MEQHKYNNTKRSWKQLNFSKRQKIDVLLKAGHKPNEVASLIGCSRRTIERERKRGEVITKRTKPDRLAPNIPMTREYIYVKEYSAEVSEQKRVINATAKGSKIKLGKDFAFAREVARHIKNKRSPYSALKLIEHEGKIKVNICLKTLYNYIDNDYIPEITNKDLPERGKTQKRDYKQTKVALNNLKGTSIEQRPQEIATRTTFGHWEYDSVESGKGVKTALLVMSERLTRHELIFKMASKSQDEVIKVINNLEQEMGSEKFKQIFKTVTCDNGSEFLNQAGLEQSVQGKGKRFDVYYCHPYSAYERGTNENINKMIRRFIPKGSDIGSYTDEQIKEIQDYINSCPRLVLEGYPSNTRYEAYTV